MKQQRHVGLQVSTSGEQLVAYRAVRDMRRKRGGLECLVSDRFIRCPVLLTMVSGSVTALAVNRWHSSWVYKRSHSNVGKSGLKVPPL